MSTHQVTLNGQAVAISRDHYKLLTMVRSFEHHDEEGKRFSVHELVMEGVDASGREVVQTVAPVSLKKGDVVEIRIDEAEPIAGANALPGSQLR